MNTELEKLAKPLIEYLKENHHPHTAIVVRDDGVEVIETCISIPTEKKTITCHVIGVKETEEQLEKFVDLLKEANSLANELASNELVLKLNI